MYNHSLRAAEIHERQEFFYQQGRIDRQVREARRARRAARAGRTSALTSTLTSTDPVIVDPVIVDRTDGGTVRVPRQWRQLSRWAFHGPAH